MKKIVTLLIIIFTVLTSCKKKGVKLPKIALNGQEKMENYSSIWFFNKDGKLDLNQNNRIASTHWLFNVDKNLPISEVFPTVSKMIVKHNEKSPHKTKNMSNYFSYANSNTDKLSFYQIDSITYTFIRKKKLPTFQAESDTVLIEIEKTNDFKNVSKNKIIQLAFKNDLSFQEYMQIKAITQKDSISVLKTEYIFN